FELRKVRRVDAGGYVRPVECRQALAGVLLVHPQDAPGVLGPADGSIAGEVQQIQRPGQGRRDLELVVERGHPLERQLVPEELLDPVLGERPASRLQVIQSRAASAWRASPSSFRESSRRTA